jgi:hypothetical protein
MCKVASVSRRFTFGADFDWTSHSLILLVTCVIVGFRNCLASSETRTLSAAASLVGRFVARLNELRLRLLSAMSTGGQAFTFDQVPAVAGGVGGANSNGGVAGGGQTDAADEGHPRTLSTASTSTHVSATGNTPYFYPQWSPSLSPRTFFGIRFRHNSKPASRFSCILGFSNSACRRPHRNPGFAWILCRLSQR